MKRQSFRQKAEIVRQIKRVVVAAASVIAGFTVVSPASAATHVVRPGESIQDAVDAASPGDTGAMEKGGCIFPGEARPASTVMPVRTTDCIVSCAVVLIRLTRFRSRRCLGRNLITVFQGVNTFDRLFLIGRRAHTGSESDDDGGGAPRSTVADSHDRHRLEKKHR